MPTLPLPLRPSVVLSVVLHAGVLVGVGSGGGRGTADRAAVVFAFEQVAVGTPIAAVEVPATDARLDDLRIEAPVEIEPTPTDPYLPPVDATLAPDETPATVPPPALPSPMAPSPTARTRPARLVATPPSAAAAAPSVPAPSVAAPSRASVLGAAQVTTFSTARPTNRPPAYPDAALRAGWQGVVWLIVDVGPDGRVATLVIERSSGYEVLDAAALDAVRAWTYAPRLVDGVPTLDRLRLPVRFAPRSVASAEGAPAR